MTDARAAPANVAYPPLFDKADHLAVEARGRHTRLVALDLLFVVSASVCFLVSGIIADKWTSETMLITLLLILGSLCVIGTLSAQVARERGQPEREWYEARGIAEASKSLTWRYALQAPPFGAGARQADGRLADALEQVLEDYGDAVWHARWLPSTPFLLPECTRQARSMPLHMRRVLYLEQRLDPEIAWYQSRMRNHEREARRWFWLSLGARLLALASAVVNIVELLISGPRFPELADTALAIAAATTAWMQLRRNEELAKSYGVAVAELVRVRRAVESSDDDHELGRAVADSEGAMTREHGKWIARRS